MLCYCGFVNVMNGAVRLLLDQPVDIGECCKRRPTILWKKEI